MLIKIRIIAATLFTTAVTLLFLDYTGTVHTYLGWCAKIQFIPALLAANIAVSLGVILITLLLGRVYCSVICPLGIFQDIVAFVSGIGKKNRFSYRTPKMAFIILRYTLPVIFAAAILTGGGTVTVLLEPYSAYGRMVSQILGPVWQWGNNLLAYFAERANSYAFHSADVWLKSASALAVALFTLAAVGIFALKSGRGYCNVICPAGAVLGLFAKFSLIKPRIDKEKCKRCGLCAKNCKAACINSEREEIDYSRCVTCFNCLKCCPKGAIKYSPPQSYKKPHDAVSPTDNISDGGMARRGFISAAATLGLGLITRTIASGYEFDGGLAPLEDKHAAPRLIPIVPPGADSYRNFSKHCTGCQLCVSTCPNQVLRPSDKNLQPQMSFERGYCRPECVKCSQVCPSGAISPITPAEKSATQIGRAVWKGELCVINTDKVSCDLCFRKCPTAAITIIDGDGGNIVMIDDNRCIGCGACEQLCPARPYSAIYVEGVETHRTV